jgi:hypothetical protein
MDDVKSISKKEIKVLLFDGEPQIIHSTLKDKNNNDLNNGEEEKEVI